MLLRIEIENVRPISRLTFEVDLRRHGIHCIVGKNGVGKTTLVKAIMNLASADTFIKTSLNSIFNQASAIRYSIEKDVYSFTYDKQQRSVTTRTPVKNAHKALISVELPMPHGQRFTFFRTLAERDKEIRAAVILGQGTKPTDLISFLSNIYEDNRFDELLEVQFRKGVCCCFVLPDKRYIREDYFSSGEYFLINLFRKVALRTPLVVIDEIDISLDARTQARLAAELRKLCPKYKSTVVFTTHSLALMQTLDPGELRYLEHDSKDGTTSLAPMAFNAVKSLMFGFEGFDRYVLTEDERLKQLVEYVIYRYCSPTFYSFQVIHVGSATYIDGLMKKNRQYRFFGPEENVIGVKDGDQKSSTNIHCLPIKDIEFAFYDLYHQPDFDKKFPNGELLNDPKELYKQITNKKILSPSEICQRLCDRHDDAMKNFANNLRKFLCSNEANS